MRGVASHEEAPAGVGAPARARIGILGETMPYEGTRMYRVKDVAAMFDVSVSTIYRAIERGQLEALKLGRSKGAVRIPGSAIEAFVDFCAAAAALEVGSDPLKRESKRDLAQEVAR